MINEKLLARRNEYITYFGKAHGYGSPEATSAKVDTVVLCDFILELLEEVKGLREDLKDKQTKETPKGEVPKATTKATK